MTTTLATIDLKAFCADEPSTRYSAHTEPQTFSGWTWATDGRAMVRVPALGPDTLTPDPKGDTAGWLTKDGRRFPSMRIIPLVSEADAADASLWYPWPGRDLWLAEGIDCARCVGDEKVWAVHCPHCNCPIGEPSPCPYCSGLPKDGPQPYAQKVGEHLVGFHYDELIRSLPNVRWRFPASHPENAGCRPLAFIFDGGNGLVMPLKRDDGR